MPCFRQNNWVDIPSNRLMNYNGASLQLQGIGGAFFNSTYSRSLERGGHCLDTTWPTTKRAKPVSFKIEVCLRLILNGLAKVSGLCWYLTLLAAFVTRKWQGRQKSIWRKSRFLGEWAGDTWHWPHKVKLGDVILCGPRTINPRIRDWGISDGRLLTYNCVLEHLEINS